MKLSEAIEDALLTRKYNRYDEFMCSVLQHQYAPELRDQLQELLNVIFPSIKTHPLIIALHEHYGVALWSNKDSMEFWDNSFHRTTEWYVWFVFDLKRKGL